MTACSLWSLLLMTPTSWSSCCVTQLEVRGGLAAGREDGSSAQRAMAAVAAGRGESSRPRGQGVRRHRAAGWETMVRAMRVIVSMAASLGDRDRAFLFWVKRADVVELPCGVKAYRLRRRRLLVCRSSRNLIGQPLRPVFRFGRRRRPSRNGGVVDPEDEVPALRLKVRRF